MSEAKLQPKLAKSLPGGAFLCVVCKVQVARDALWNAHVQSRQHAASIRALQELKAKKTGAPAPQRKSAAQAPAAAAAAAADVEADSGDVAPGVPAAKPAVQMVGGVALPADFFGSASSSSSSSSASADGAGPAAKKQKTTTGSAFVISGGGTATGTTAAAAPRTNSAAAAKSATNGAVATPAAAAAAARPAAVAAPAATAPAVRTPAPVAAAAAAPVSAAASSSAAPSGDADANGGDEPTGDGTADGDADDLLLSNELQAFESAIAGAEADAAVDRAKMQAAFQSFEAREAQAEADALAERVAAAKQAADAAKRQLAEAAAAALAAGQKRKAPEPATAAVPAPATDAADGDGDEDDDGDDDDDGAFDIDAALPDWRTGGKQSSGAHKHTHNPNGTFRMSVNANEELLKKLGKSCDFLKLANDKKLLALFDKAAASKAVETVLFSDTVYKINRREKPQQRDLVVTSLTLYNFEPKKYAAAKRAIGISKLAGLVLQKGSSEILLKVKNDYDYRYEVVRQAELVKILQAQYAILTGGVPLSVTFSDDLSKNQVFKEDIKSSPTAAGGGSGGGGGASGMAINEMIADKDQFRIAREGWLSKKGKHHDTWKRRFFRLCDKTILYYDARQKGKVDLESGAVRTFTDKRHHEFEVSYKTPHLFKMLLDKPETREPLLKFATAAHDDYLNVYLEVEDYRKIATWLPNSPSSYEAAAKIYDRYIRQGAECEINLSPVQKADYKDVVEHQKATAETFDALQAAAMENIKMTLLPDFLAQEAKKRDTTFKLKKALTDDDKKCTHCSTCLAEFGFLRARNWCRYCGDVFCSSCVSKKCKLPAHFKVDESLNVCDVCYGCVGPDKQPFGFSYASKTRNKPLNLAAATAAEQTVWVDAIRSTVELAASTKAAGGKPGGDNGASLDLSIHLEGWLLKEDPTTKLWRRRYFVLHGGALYYYEMFLKGCLSLAEGAGLAANAKEPTIKDAEATVGGLKSTSNFAYRFTVSQTDRLYKLAADTEVSMNGWIDVMNDTIKPPEQKTPSSGGSGAVRASTTGGAATAAAASGAGAAGAAAAAGAGAANGSSSGSSDAQALTDQYSASFAQRAPEGQVTFVFTDVQNSTKLWELAGPAMNLGLEKHDALLRMLLKQCHGYEVKTEGDAFMVTFFNVLDAVRWCIAVQLALLQLVWPDELVKQSAANKEFAKDGKTLVWNGIRVRMGIHTGTPNCRRNPTHGRMDYFGPVVNRSARVADSAHGGQIIATQEVMDVLEAGQKAGDFKLAITTEELGAFPYKGIADPVKVFQITPKELAGRNPFPKLRIEEKMPKKDLKSAPAAVVAAAAAADKKKAEAAAKAAAAGSGASAGSGAAAAAGAEEAPVAGGVVAPVAVSAGDDAPPPPPSAD